jgi:hypothetical protein
MSHDHHHGLRIVRQWPRWAVVPIGLAMAAVAVLLGLVLEPAGYALAPGKVEPEPTLPAVGYGRDQSDGCQACHFSPDALEASADDPNTAGDYLIDAASPQTPHGSLGCVACHGGEGLAEAKESGHRGLIRDITEAQPKQCLICHHDLPDQFPGDDLLIPHELVEDKIVHGEVGELFCSDCHGGVGHGFDPVTGNVACSMMVCVDCHAEQDACRSCHQNAATGAEMSGCDLCHEGPHDVAEYLTCPCCHTSLTTWAEIDPASHPVELPGRHGEAGCFECHQFPDFRGLNYVCADCHESGHTAWGDEDCTQCHDPGATWDIVASTWDRHIEHWDMYKGDHLKVQCQGCHFETYTDLDPSCDSCHDLPRSHDASYTRCWLCH